MTVGRSRQEIIDSYVEALGDVLGIRHAFDTCIGNALLRGISGGEKKRVSIGELLGANVKLSCWDKSVYSVSNQSNALIMPLIALLVD